MCWQKIKEWLFPPEPVEPVEPPEPVTITYLVINPDEQAPVWDVPAGVVKLGYMRSGDAVPVRETRNWEGFIWYEVLCGHLYQFETGTTGWVKFKSDKMYLEER